MPSERNIERVEDLAGRLARSRIIIATGFTGLPVGVLNQFRLRLREKGLEYKVVKNTLAAMAAERVGKAGVKGLLEGPTGLLLGYGEPVEAAKLLDEYLRSTRVALVIRGAVMDGQVLTAQQVSALAALPPKPELVAHLAGSLKGRLARLLTLFQTPGLGLVLALSAPARGLATVLHRSAEATQKETG